MNADRSLDVAERRIEKWLKPDRALYGPDMDGPVYRAMVEQLVGVMNVVGPADSMEGITALTKTLALVLATTLRLEDDVKVAEICAGQGAWLENEVMALRKAMSSPARKGN